MNKKIVIALVLLSLGGILFAQSLENNDYYKQSLEYARLSQQSMDSGNYLLAREQAEKSEEFAALSRQYIQEMLTMYRARSSYIAARARMDAANRFNLKTRDKDLFDQASSYFSSATAKYNAKDYENSLPDSRQVIELLKDLEARYASAGGLAAFYKVKLDTANRDCLWKIAGFDFVYGNPWEWKRLYDANKNSFPEPANPDLIVPDMVLTIPSIRGEARNGTR